MLDETLSGSQPVVRSAENLLGMGAFGDPGGRSPCGFRIASRREGGGYSWREEKRNKGGGDSSMGGGGSEPVMDRDWEM